MGLGRGSALLQQPSPAAPVPAYGGATAGAGGGGLQDILSGIRGVTNSLGANFAKDPAKQQYYQGVQADESAQARADKQASYESNLQSFEWFAEMAKLPNSAEIFSKPAMLQQLQTRGQILDAVAPNPGYGQEMVNAILEMANAPKPAEDGFSLGDTRYDAAGNPIVTNPGEIGEQDVTGPILKKISEQGYDSLTPPEKQAWEMAKAKAAEQGVKIELGFNPDGTISATPSGGGFGGSGGASGGFGKPTSQQLQDTTGLSQFYERGIAQIDEVIKIADRPGSQLGFIGAGKRILGEAGRMIGEAGEEAPQAFESFSGLAQLGRDMINEEVKAGGEGSEGLEQFFVAGDINSLPVIEGALAYLYARSLQPDGKLLMDAIKTAKDASRLQKWTRSEETTVQYLFRIKRGLAKAKRDLLSSVPGVSAPAEPAAEDQTTQEAPEGGDNPLAEAKAAIAAGADPAAVKARLKQMGIDPKGL